MKLLVCRDRPRIIVPHPSRHAAHVHCGNLKRFPLSALKIDRSFVHDIGVDPGSGSIVEAIIALAQKFKLEIVAEGVEHEAQRRFLVKGGCSSMQGFLLGRPLPMADFEHVYSTAGHGCG